MQIDLNQLPIPDWGLICPRCRYPLRGLPSHRCPQCGTKFDMEQLVQTWHRLRPPRFDGRELPWPDFGLRCRRCDAALAGVERFACAACGTEFDPDAFRPRRDWFILGPESAGRLTMPAVEALFAAEYVPYLRQTTTTMQEIYGGQRVPGQRVQIPTEFYFDAMWLLRRAELQMRESAAAAAAAGDWPCASCGEAVPAHFEICWQCGATRA